MSIKIFNTCRHQWSLWGYLVPCYSGFKSNQARRCNKCGKIDIRTVSHLQVSIIDINNSIEGKGNETS